MKEQAVFFGTMGIVGTDGLGSDGSSAPLGSEEWKALRLLTLAGYTIVLFTHDRSVVYAECPDAQWPSRSDVRSKRATERHQEDLNRQITPLLKAAATLEIDLAQSWMVGNTLDSIEAGRCVGCKTLFLMDGNETGWEMTAARWPDLIARDLWEIACVIVMADGSSVEGLTASLDDDD